jgi:hypothetical protein
VRLGLQLVLAAAFAALPVALAVASCGTDAVGVDACRQIEDARCTLAAQCSPGFDSDRCQRFYRDACLAGIQNPDAGAGFDPNMLAQPCVDAINALGPCLADGGAGCTPPQLVPDPTCPGGNPMNACDILMKCPEVLTYCSFIAAPPTLEAGTATDSGDTGDGGDAGDAATD